MKTLSIREMRGALGRLDQILEREDEIVIARRGEAIARVVPIRPHRSLPSHEDLRAQMPRLSSSAELIREDRDSGG
jgi:antitoxin (DNA-binding transcriptional repressor) of toxin-antitoxin stability system